MPVLSVELLKLLEESKVNSLVMVLVEKANFGIKNSVVGYQLT